MPAAASPYGPIRITENRQITLPKALLDETELRPGDHVYVLRDADGLLRIVDLESVVEWVKAGRGRATGRIEEI